jgi:protein TonB
VIVTESAGHPRLDAAVLEAVRQWKFMPAQKAETPVEALQEFAITLTVRP